MAEPIAVYQGEIFDQIVLFRDHIEVKGGPGEVSMTIREMEWQSPRRPCPYTECRNHADIPDIDCCLLNLDKDHTLDEIGQILGGLSRERVRQLVDGASENSRHHQPGALEKFGRRFKRLTKANSMHDILPDPSIYPQTKSPHKRRTR